MTRYLALSMTGELQGLDYCIRGYDVQKAALGRSNYGVGLARIYGSRARSVLLVGSETLQVFRPDLKLTEVRGVPFVVGLSMGKAVVAVATWHPTIARKTKQLREQFEGDVKQFLWRGMYVMGRWPDMCVKCGGELEEYDVQGVGWCKDHWTGPDVPKFKEQLSLLDAETAVA